MRRVGLAALVAGIALTGCGSFRDVFTSHADTAARVGTRELKSSRVAEIISRIGRGNANPQAAELVTGIWADISLYADALAAGTFKPDSVTIERLMWQELAEARVNAWHDSVVARRAAVSPATADSLYNAGQIRLFQHILFMAAGPKAADTAKAKATADKVLPQAKKGDFGKLAAQYSADGSKNDAGYLPPGPRGGFVAEFDSVAWSLEPGQVSGLVKTQFGFHVIRRPPENEIRDRLMGYLKDQQKGHQDSIYMADLTARNGLTVNSGAVAAMRSALADPTAARKSGKQLVALKSGAFTVGDMVKWLGALAPQQINQVRMANDTMLGNFVKILAQNAILLREADSAKIRPNPAIHQAVSLKYQSDIGNLKEALGLTGPEFSDSSKTPPAERRKLAEKKVDEYFDKLTRGETAFRPVPPTLSADLRAGGDFKIYQAGVAHAMELIIAQKRKDSAAGGGAVPGGPLAGLRPAPGGPPQPGQRPDTTKQP
jgi:hypothetical protein